MLTAYALRLRVGGPIGGASARHQMEPSPSAAGGGSIPRPVSLHVVAGFGGRRRELALLRGHSGVGSRPSDSGEAAPREGRSGGMWWPTGRTTGGGGQVGAGAGMEGRLQGAEKEREEDLRK
jgi:hypothetical protein